MEIEENDYKNIENSVNVLYSRRGIGEELIGGLEDGAKKFYYNAAPKDREMENVKEKLRDRNNRFISSNNHLIQFPGEDKLFKEITKEKFS